MSAPHNQIKYKYDNTGLLPTNARLTSQRAEIYAAQQAIDVLRTYVRLFRHQRIIIITDSDYLTKSMSEYVYNWVNNGWMNAKGTPVVNGRSLEKLHDTIADLESEGKRVRFWRVSRDQNQEADDLANEALDEM
ncbi:hypothetical protein GP486_001772 [Trichoglossum hirsutum]|uniref:RNase H type-1 domain-containing protein n=1 Tax=Trichoglossum hirsutum TaxID=265104 RepID=A0A9P8LG71_9PEZI|nr:hypothetical protein GP486_001772 [Trichoglossum hirsutum]